MTPAPKIIATMNTRPAAATTHAAIRVGRSNFSDRDRGSAARGSAAVVDGVGRSGVSVMRGSLPTHR
jgi:hypothetical protein